MMRASGGLIFIVLAAFTCSCAAQTWTFAVSGDSRNCGDIVMPSIAGAAIQNRVAFYWHLGDFRAIYMVDQDIGSGKTPAEMKAYGEMAWGDFELHELGPFAGLPVYLARGNHETIGGRTRGQYVAEFRPWLDQPAIREQRLRDDPSAEEPTSYYHWIQNGIDFIALDNAAEENFDPPQLAWFENVLERAAGSAEVKTVVLGMHAALPDSLSAGHSMNDTPAGQVSGRKVYADLVAFRKKTGKRVYALSSHSHFIMSDIYDTACRREHPEDVLPGWIIGTAGAVRYRLPQEHTAAKIAKTDVYGYLLATVSPDGAIQFDFKQIDEDQITPAVRQHYSKDLIDFCFTQNASSRVVEGPAQPPNCPPQ